MNAVHPSTLIAHEIEDPIVANQKPCQDTGLIGHIICGLKENMYCKGERAQ